jgi:hypothetical protein
VSPQCSLTGSVPGIVIQQVPRKTALNFTYGFAGNCNAQSPPASKWAVATDRTSNRANICDKGSMAFLDDHYNKLDHDA